MYKIIVYENGTGYSELNDFLLDLARKADSNKDARIQLRQITFYIELLKMYGTNINQTFTKHLVDEIWELRPGNNRILYFFYNGEAFVLLHHFRKKTQKTPTNEIEKAKREIQDFKSRMEVEKHENLGRL